jgi:hypothetical protein
MAVELMMKFYSEARRILTAQKILSTTLVTSSDEACECVEEKEIDGNVSSGKPHRARLRGLAPCGKAEDGSG